MVRLCHAQTISSTRRDAGVVERDGLENRYRLCLSRVRIPVSPPYFPRKRMLPGAFCVLGQLNDVRRPPQVTIRVLQGA